MVDRFAATPWELAASPSGFVRTWVNATFRPKAFVAGLGDRSSLARAALYAAVAVVLSVALVAGITAAATYSSLQRFGASDSLGRLLALQMGWHVGEMVSFLVAAALSTAVVSLIARRPVADAFRARMYTAGPITWLIAWWVMFRWLEKGSGPPWRARLLAVGGWIAELALAMALSSFLSGAIRDATFDAFYRA